MRALTHHGMRAVVATTTTLAIGLTGLAFAPSASAFYGSEATVKNAVLTTAEAAKAIGWTGGPLTGKLAQEDVLDWSNTITVSPMLDTDAAPGLVELIVLESPQDRDNFFTLLKLLLIGGDTQTVLTNTSSLVTVDDFYPAEGSDPAVYAALSLRKAGSDAVAVGGCEATATTTTTAGARGSCAAALSNAQAAKWAAISPTLVWKSTSTVKSKMVSASAARTATKAPKGTKTKVVSTKSLKVFNNGRQVLRKYDTTGAKLNKLRVAVPRYSGVTQYGNRINASVAFRKGRAGDLRDSTFHTSGTDRYTSSYKVKDKEKKVTARMASTVILYSDVIIVGTCRGNDAKLPKGKTIRTCSKRLANAQLAKVKTLFAGVR